MEDNMDIDIEKKPADRVVLNIDKILDEARVLGCSDVHFTTRSHLSFVFTVHYVSSALTLR